MTMPRWNTFRQLDRDKLTDFARIIYDYLLGFQPTKLVSELADESGVSNNAIWSWLKYGITPKRAKVVQLAEHTDLDLEEMLKAAGLPSTEEMERARGAYIANPIESIEVFVDDLMESPDIDEKGKAVIAARLQFARSQPNQFVRTTNTYREWNADSPLEHEAQRAADSAHIIDPTEDEQQHRRRPTQPHEHPQTDA